MGYHNKQIKKGRFGEISKIEEEFEEFKDAVEQANPIMALMELSDLIGAIEAYLEHYYPSIGLLHLITMKKATKRAFEDGTRN